ncbi:MAG: fibronectin type III domain-containing protein [Spirochaetia bacterium]|nr:fibronectin type III domain-containing protein [Spirochaetia bacterium]
MKNILLYLPLLLLTLVASSCDYDRETEISTAHENHFPANVELLEYTPNSITVAWDFVEGATSYTVQLLNTADSDYPLVTYTTTDEDYYQFTGLSRRENYYARVRANFPYSAVSRWSYLMDGEQSARIMTAYGIVDPDFEITEVKLIASSSSTLTIAWSFTDFMELESEISNICTLELFNDEACTDLYISWEEIPANLFNTTTRPLRFTFSGLDSNKDYFVRITDVSSDLQSRVYKFATAADAPAVGGNVILSQDFSNFIHGGDILYNAAGYTRGAGPGRAIWEKAVGKNPVDPANGQATCNTSTEFNVFDGGNVSVAYTEGAGMKDWGKHGNTSTRPGYIKMGGSKAGATLYTPELSSLTGATTLKVRFRAAMYKEGDTSYCEDVLVQVVEGATFNEKGAITNQSSVTVSSEKRVSILDADGDFATFEVELNGVTPTSRIAFASDYAKASANKTRFLLDDIVIMK